MSDFVKEALKRLLKEQGEYLCSDVNRLTGLLCDACPSYRDEISVLILAVQEGLIDELKKGVISEVNLHSFSTQLHNATGIDKALAEWSIRAWAEALGLEFQSKTRTLYCSFCGKGQHEVRVLIAGPSVFICDECVELCMDIIREKRERLLYRSDFYYPSDKWGEGASDNYRAFRQDGYYHIAIYRLPWTRWQYLKIPPIADFRAHVDSEFVANSGETAVCGVVFRLRSDNSKDSFYSFSISRSGYYGLQTHVNEEWKDILNYRFSEFIRRNDSTNSLMIEMVGQKITLGINGQILATVMDSKLTCGKIGLFVAGYSGDSFAEARFRDFRLYSIE